MGRKVISGGEKGREREYGDGSGKPEVWQSYADDYLRLRDQGIGKTDARRRVARTYGVSYKTIERHTKNP